VTLLEHRIWHARDGWRVELRDAAHWYEFGPYPTVSVARLVAEELTRKLERERPRPSDPTPASA